MIRLTALGSIQLSFRREELSERLPLPSQRLLPAKRAALLLLLSLAEDRPLDEGVPPIRARLLPMLLCASLAVGEPPQISSLLPPASASCWGPGECPNHLLAPPPFCCTPAAACVPLPSMPSADLHDET